MKKNQTATVTTAFWKKALLFVLLAAALLYALAIWGERKLVLVLEEKIAAAGVLKYSRMDISLLAGNVAFTDAAIDFKWAEQGKHLNIYSPRIRIHGLGWRNLYFDKKITIKSVHLQSPDVTVRDMHRDTLKAMSADSAVSAPTLPMKIMALEIRRANLVGGCVEVFRKGGDNDGVPNIQAANLNISLHGMAFNLQADEVIAPAFEEADLLLEGLAVNDRQSRHHFTLEKFHLNKRDSLLEIHGLLLDPKDKPSAFFNQMAYRKAWFDLNLPSATVSGWQFGRMLEGAFVARKMSVDGVKMKVRTNQNLKPDPKANRPMPQELLRSSPFAIAIDSVVIKKGGLTFENIGPGKTEVGVITFNPITALFSNVTNDSARVAQQKIMEVDAVGYCQGKYPVYNHFWFDLAGPANSFSFKGNASNIPFVSLNSFIKPSTNVFFDDGTINHISFDANADERTATGSLSMDYENLHFSLLNDDRERRKTLSKVVDLLFLKADNDKSGEDFLPGKIYVQRDVRLSFLNYWWTAIQSGIKTSLLKEKMLEKVDKRMAKKEAKRKERKARRRR